MSSPKDCFNETIGFGDPPEELVAWVQRTEWIKDVEREWRKRVDERKESWKNLASSKERRM